MIDQKLLYAIVGASSNEEKYGHKVFADLLVWWYKAIPINPNEKNILWKRAYPALSAYKKKIDVVIFVTPPAVTEKVLEDVKNLGIKNVRMQPGAQSDQAIAFCEKNKIACVHDACIMIKRKKILVWLSGGVDSAVTAHLLKKQWYDVTAGFMKNYVSEKGNCSTHEDATEAIKVAKFLWIKIISFDLQKEYKEKIINYIYEGYKKWITPNPDVLCNSLIKFDVFLERALEMGFDAIATWHYAQIKKAGKNHTLLRWIDRNKDQSYFLAWLNQFQLSKSLFPIWELEKKDVRAIAKKIPNASGQVWLPNAERKDSQGLCFVGNIPIKTFLEQKLPHKQWTIVEEGGKILGKHDGARFYTIGQRHGLNLAPDLYVTTIDVKKNVVYVWARNDEELNKKIINLKDRHRIGKKYTLPLKVTAKIRYRHEPETAILSNGGKKITFKDAQWAVAPGQVVVVYVGEECVGSGIISS